MKQAPSHIEMCRFARAAYGPNDFTAWLDYAAQFTPVGMDARIISVNDTECALFEDDEDLILSFRGTEPTHARDIFSDIDVRWSEHPWGHVYRGFSRALSYVRDRLFGIVDRAHCDGKRISIGGHSLGGVLAQYMSDYCFRSEIEPTQVVTFGQPRGGNAQYAANYNKQLGPRHFRYVIYSDPVTLAPSSIRGGRHVGNLRWYTGMGWHDKRVLWRMAAVAVGSLIFRTLIRRKFSHPSSSYGEVMNAHGICAQFPMG